MTSQGIFNLERQKMLLNFREIFNSLSTFYANQIEKRKAQILPTGVMLSGANQ